MSDNYVLNLFADLRKQLLNVITSLSKSQLDYIPRGFSNNVHWQLGHVLTVTDELIFVFSGDESKILPDYRSYFASGTSPKQWSEPPPEIEILVKGLEIQMLEICEGFEGKLAQPVTDRSNFLQASVISDLFHVLIAHESMHLGMINAMAKLLKNDIG